MSSQPLLIILGPTACGKTKLAVSLANDFNGEIISADSRQVFSGMDIGTGKDLEEYQISGRNINYHLIDIIGAGENYNVNLFKEDFYTAFTAISVHQKLPILCGGTGMYIHSLLQNHDFTAVPVNDLLRNSLNDLSKEELQTRLITYPEPLRKHADFSSSKRLIRAIEIAAYLSKNELPKIEKPTFSPLIIGLQSDVETRRERILARLDARINEGLIEEVKSLLFKGVSVEMLTFYGLEYKFVVAHLMNEMDLPTLREKLGIAICQFAKRQMTFFRKMEKDGIKINWLNTDEGFDLLKSKSVELINSKLI